MDHCEYVILEYNELQKGAMLQQNKVLTVIRKNLQEVVQDSGDSRNCAKLASIVRHLTTLDAWRTKPKFTPLLGT